MQKMPRNRQGPHPAADQGESAGLEPVEARTAAMPGLRGNGGEAVKIICGLTLEDIKSCAGMSQKEAAKRLGVGYAHFNTVMLRHGLTHLFPKPPQRFTQCVTVEDIARAAAEGYTQKDAAFILDVSERYFKSLVARWGLNGLFPNSGKAAWISRNGYAR